MRAQPPSEEALIQRLLPSANPDPEDRAHAWAEWYEAIGGQAVRKFIRVHNYTAEPDDDILQDAMLTAYADVERGGYERRTGIPSRPTSRASRGTKSVRRNADSGAGRAGKRSSMRPPASRPMRRPGSWSTPSSAASNSLRCSRRSPGCQRGAARCSSATWAVKASPASPPGSRSPPTWCGKISTAVCADCSSSASSTKAH